MLNKDELFLVSIKLDLSSILNLSLCNKRLNEKIYKSEIWSHKLKKFPDYLKLANIENKKDVN